MKNRNKYLTGILFILIGILIGTILTLLQQDVFINDQTQVQFTEVRRSSTPILSDEEIQAIDDRFLFKSVADQVRPTVVYIETVIPVGGDSVPETPDDENTDQEDSFWDRLLPRQALTVGSGVLISGDGYILTNNHVIEEALEDGIEVVLNDKRMYEARIVGTDPTTDLAVIKIDDTGLPSIVVGNSDEVDVGEWVMAVGNPFRLQSTVTAGIVSAMGRDVQIINERMRIESFIQTDAAINKGNSGGALVNTSGELIGINTAIASQTGSYQGYGFAVPINLAIKVARDIMQYGEVHRALLGVSIEGVDYNLARDLGMDAIEGVMIVEVQPGSVAEQFGLESRDVVLAVNDQVVSEANELQEKIAVMSPGDVVKLRIWRDGEVFERNVTLGSEEANGISLSNSLEIQPEEEEQNQNTENGVEFGTFSLGFKVMALSKPEDARQFDLIISEVEENSEARTRGLKEGYHIREVEAKVVEDLKTLQDLVAQSLKARGAVSLQIETEDGTIGYFELKQ